MASLLRTEPLHDRWLAQGQTTSIALPAGGLLVVRSGRLRVDGPPQWLAGTLLSPTRYLDEGESLHLEQGGWVALQAMRPGAWAAVAPATAAPLWQVAWARWRRRTGRRPQGADTAHP